MAKIRVRIKTMSGDKQHSQTECPQANRLKESDPDITRVWIDLDRREIRFSRLSTGMRYVYEMSPRSHAFAMKFDRTGKAKAFWLVLGNKDLIKSYPRIKNLSPNRGGYLPTTRKFRSTITR